MGGAATGGVASSKDGSKAGVVLTESAGVEVRQDWARGIEGRREEEVTEEGRELVGVRVRQNVGVVVSDRV